MRARLLKPQSCALLCQASQAHPFLAQLVLVLCAPLIMSNMPQDFQMRRRQVVGAAFASDFNQIGDDSSQDIFVSAEARSSKILEEEQRMIEKVFQIVDKDQANTIDAKKLMQMFKLFGVESVYVEAAIQKVMANVDKDMDGLITREEFASVLSRKFEESDTPEEMQACFNLMDTNKDEKLDCAELLKVAEELGDVDMDMTEIKSMITNLINVHQKRERRLALQGGMELGGKEKGDDFHGKIKEKLNSKTKEPEYYIQSEELKPLWGKATVLFDLQKYPAMKVGDSVNFKVDKKGDRAIEVKDPELDWDTFYSVMCEEL